MSGYKGVKYSHLTILGMALILMLSTSGIGETGMMLKAEETSSETKKCNDEHGEIFCPHFQDDGSATTG